jgi:hypothetical protein
MPGRQGPRGEGCRTVRPTVQSARLRSLPDRRGHQCRCARQGPPRRSRGGRGGFLREPHAVTARGQPRSPRHEALPHRQELPLFSGLGAAPNPPPGRATPAYSPWAMWWTMYMARPSPPSAPIAPLPWTPRSSAPPSAIPARRAGEDSRHPYDPKAGKSHGSEERDR